jgi:ribulose-5-phosphate 4-epimerase/fuculose-1-phosphate aldolase
MEQPGIAMDGAGHVADAPVTEAERRTRVELAACYRLARQEGWDELVYNHISARVPGPAEHFLINAFGLAFEEVTASNLVKIDLDGNVVGSERRPVNAAGFTIHSAVHAARPEVACVIHLHTEAGMALSMLEEGLLPLSQTAMFFAGNVAYHDSEGVALDLAERARLVRDLADKAVLVLRNHGTLVAGRSIGEAYVTMYLLEKAARAQLKAMATGARLATPPEAAIATNAAFARRGGGGVEQAWQAMLRRLDRSDPSYRD